tara:strand:+ start:6312 stop:7001 length:690 start_codon:yes stop_codon:yes gene_type:complete
MACTKCKTKEECGCKQEALHISQICNPVACDVEECSETFNAGCILYADADIICNEVVLVTAGDTMAQALANVSAYFCSTEAVETQILCGADVVVPAGTQLENALPLIVTYFCNAISALELPTGLYTGLITQSVSDAPTVSIPSAGNTIGAIVWTRFSAGVYRGTLAGAFTNTTVCSITQAPILASSVVSCFLQMGKQTNDYVEIRVYDTDGVTLVDTRLTGASFKIETW